MSTARPNRYGQARAGGRQAVPVMSELWEPEQLLAPISAARPCGEDLEYSDTLASFDSFRLFGESVPLEWIPPRRGDADEAERRESDKRIPKPREWAEWPVIRDRAAEALARSKDFRLLSILATALLRTDGVPAFCATVGVAARWLDTYWTDVFPRVDDDAIMRRNALNNFADPMAIVEGLRRTPLVSSRQHGIFSLRDLEMAARPQTPPAPAAEERAVDENQVAAAFAATAPADLASLHRDVAEAVAAVKRIDAVMRETSGDDAAPALGGLLMVLNRLTQVLKARLTTAPAGDGDVADDTAAAAATPVMRVGAIGSREDAVRALDAVAEFFRRTEPSSPIPLFVMRAKRLVAKDFLEVLADVAPDAVATAKMAGGVREEQN